MEVGNGVDGRSLSIQGTARWKKKKKIHKPLIVNVEEGQ